MLTYHCPEGCHETGAGVEGMRLNLGRWLCLVPEYAGPAVDVGTRRRSYTLSLRTKVTSHDGRE